MEKSKRKEREFQARRAEILEEAEKIFASKGFHNATVAEIAGASGFAIGTLYQFFESKEKLYLTLMNEKLERMYGEMRKAVERKKEFFEKLEALIRSNFHFVERNRDFCRLLIRGGEVSTPDGSISRVRQEIISNYLMQIDFVEEIIQEGVSKGLLRRMDTRFMACALFGMLNSLKFIWIITPKKETLNQRVSDVMGIFLRGVREDAGP
ncbi:MAG: TetR/AcrR family transcriptional regulator [Syntrophales bacterium]